LTTLLRSVTDGFNTALYLIVGAGSRASTALYLRQSDPSAIVTLLDQTSFPNPSAASHDLNKIIRADYDDIFYMKLALEAQRLWRSDPIYKPYYRESGMLFAEDMGMCRKCVENYKALGEESVAEMITPEEARARFSEFKDAEWTDVKELQPTEWVGEAEPALRSVIQAAVDHGVIYIAATVLTLSINQIEPALAFKPRTAETNSGSYHSVYRATDCQASC
jgi:sarcosine oxidase/L-pipecolate oxidase